MRKDHPLADRKEIQVEDLINQQLVFPERTGARAEVINWFQDGEEPEIAYTSNLSSTAAEIVMASDAVALIIDGALTCYDTSSLVKIPLVPNLESGTVLAYKKGVPFTAAANEFFNTIRKLACI